MLPVDVGLIAAAAAPYLAKGGDSFIKTAGEGLGKKFVELCQAVENKFKGDTFAEQTLARAKEKPESEDRQAALKDVLAEKMEKDTKFAEEVGKLIEAIEEKGTASSVFDQRGQIIHGSQTNIAGNVNGPVLSGNFHGSVNARESK